MIRREYGKAAMVLGSASHRRSEKVVKKLEKADGGAGPALLPPRPNPKVRAAAFKIYLAGGCLDSSGDLKQAPRDLTDAAEWRLPG